MGLSDLRRHPGPDTAFTGTKSHGGHGAVFPTQNFHFSFPPSKKLPEDRKAVHDVLAAQASSLY
jgi:hypothetical protein